MSANPTDSRSAPDVLLIGYQDQGNLGMGYLAATLLRHGRSVELVDIREGPARIAERVAARPPIVVGFSLIFQFFLPQFRRVAAALRKAGVKSHLTVGGHFPSLCPDEVLHLMPELDSVVRYEGELTLLDLVERLATGDDWRLAPGLAFLAGGEPRESEPRALVHDLDTLPFPYRPYPPEQIVGFRTLPVLASRGCARRCSFCSIHTFYRTAPGKTVRVRRPENVIEEMLSLWRDHAVRIFLFQDDDFPLWGRVGKRWADELVERMHQTGLAQNTIWKISCRAEYVETELFAKLRDAGLFLVYMGIESGNESGLEVLHKQLTVEQNLAAVQTLKSLGIFFSYGFMLLDPSSTFESVRTNIRFLRQMVGDGSAAATFCRMLPYGGTPIRDRLLLEGRLKGDVTHPDYDFLDPRLNHYYTLLRRAAGPWIHDEGVSHQLNWAWDELETVQRLVAGLDGLDAYRADLAGITAASNEQLFQLVERSSIAFERGENSGLDAAQTTAVCAAIRANLLRRRNAFFTDNADIVTAASRTTGVHGPVMAPQVH
jgi:radical SAM superfamily enzyme YgiQ (UPF0313 family)